MKVSHRSCAARLAVAVAVAAAWPAHADPPAAYTYRKFGVEQGLDNLSLWDIAQDGDGLMWFGTEDGLYRYDGVRFTRLDRHDGLPSNQIFVLHAGASGLWAGTAAGLARIDRSPGHGGRIEAVGRARGLPEERVLELAIGPRGDVWVAMELGLFHQVGDRFELAPGWPGGPSRAVWVGDDGGVIAGRGEDLVARDAAGRWTVLGKTAGFGREAIDAIARDGDGVLWVRSARYLWSCDRQTLVCSDVSAALPDVNVMGRLFVDRRGTLCVPTHRGLACHRGGTWEVLGVDRGLPSRTVWSVYEDREGSLWMMADTLYQLLGRGLWQSYAADERFPADIVWAIARDGRGRLWIGTNKGLIAAVDRGWTVIAGTETETMHDVVRGPDGALYAGGVPAHVIRYDPEAGTLSDLGPDPAPGDRITSLAFDRAGTLWAGTLTAGLWARTPAGAWHREALPGEALHEQVDQVLVDRAGRVWAAGSAGLAVHDAGRWQRFTEADGLAATAISYLVDRKSGEVCVAYTEGSGGTCLRYAGGALTAIHHLTRADGIASDKIYMLGEDDRGRLYLGFGVGLDVISRDAGGHPVIEYFSSATGMVGDDIAAHAFWSDPGGDVLVGTTRGLARFDAAHYAGPAAPPRALVLAAWLAGDSPPVTRPPLEAPGPGDTTFSARFAAPTFAHTGQVEHQVRLSPLETGWRPSLDSQAHYPRLGPGDYVFEVRARIAPGGYGPPAQVAFTVQPAWWQTLWFRALCVLAIAAAIAAVIAWRARVITARAARQIVARSEASFRALIDQSPDAVVVHRELALIYVNRMAIAMLGCSSESELLGRSILELVHPDERASVSERARGLIATGDPTAPRELRIVRKDGTLVFAEVASLMVDFGGAPAMLSIARDCTERKQLEARLLLSDRMASLGTLAAGVAHEINNPLAYVKTNIELLSEELANIAIAPELRAAVADAIEGATRVQTIVAGLKAFSRADTERRQPVDLHHALDLALRMTGNEIRHRCRVTKAYGEVPLVLGDESRLGQLFINLLINAAQSIAEGRVDGNEIRITTSVGACGRAIVEIRDTGCGMPPDVVKRVFDPFFTTKDVGVGTGLGLAICHGIVTAHGGEITVDSEVGRGTAFRVALPGATASALASAPGPVAPAPAALRELLIVDDDDRLRVSLGRALGKEHQVTLASCAADALAMLAAGRRFDLIVSDLMMPEMTGMEFYRAISGLDADQAARMVFMTGGAFTAEARAFVDEIRDRCLEKPFHIGELRELVRRLSRRDTATAA